MIYRSEKMAYSTVMKVLHGSANDVEVCEALQGNTGAYYTLWIIKDHEVVKKVIRILESSASNYDCCLELFTWQNLFCMVFAYVRERPVDVFYMADAMELGQCGEICKSLTLSCMMSKLPYPFLYLVLRQHEVHLYADSNTELGYGIDLSELDEHCGEERCIRQCALLVRWLLQQKSGKQNTAYLLFVKKISQQGYKSFVELYRDIVLSLSVQKKEAWRQRVKAFFYRNRRVFFRALFIGSALLALLAVFHLISETVWGNLVFFRILVNHFEVIGTESMMN